MTDATTETKEEKKFDTEAFAMNIARAMESGGKALAAYLKPRENGELKDKSTEEMGEVVKTLTTVAEYWLSDHERSSDLQTRMAKGYLDLWGSAMRRMAGEEAMPAISPSTSVSPIPNGSRTNSSIS
jgi:polyhydroxyalkanoate synthase